MITSSVFPSVHRLSVRPFLLSSSYSYILVAAVISLMTEPIKKVIISEGNLRSDKRSAIYLFFKTHTDGHGQRNETIILVIII